jgi:hypothetical protein
MTTSDDRVPNDAILAEKCAAQPQILESNSYSLALQQFDACLRSGDLRLEVFDPHSDLDHAAMLESDCHKIGVAVTDARPDIFDGAVCSVPRTTGLCSCQRRTP